MSVDHQANLAMETPPESHLSHNLDVGCASNYGADGPGEYFCKVCDTRITRSTTSYNEYGHQRSCEHHEVYSGDGS